MPSEKHYSSKRDHSPEGDDRGSHGVKRRRSRSPRHHRHSTEPRERKAKLPFGSRHLHKHDLTSHEALFAHYLDLQKQLDIDRLSEDQVKGRWKSFLGKWNRGELAEGWYDPETKKKADERAIARTAIPSDGKDATTISRLNERPADDHANDAEDSEDYGPAAPQAERTKRGPTAPNFQDLQHRQELDDEDRLAARKDLRYERKQDRAIQKERLDELVPRAEPGTRERQLEKKRDVAASNKTFAEAREGGAEEVGEGDLMGDDGVEGYKAKRKEMERQKNERELRKEEMLRARAAEREVRLEEHRKKEEKTMQLLKDIAQQRFGGQA